MATRDLTVTYLRLRSALHRKAPGRDGGASDASGGGTGLLGGAGGGVDTAPLVMAGASPIYVEMVAEITGDMNAIQAKSAWSARSVRAACVCERAAACRA